MDRKDSVQKSYELLDYLRLESGLYLASVRKAFIKRNKRILDFKADCEKIKGYIETSQNLCYAVTPYPATIHWRYDLI